MSYLQREPRFLKKLRATVGLSQGVGELVGTRVLYRRHHRRSARGLLGARCIADASLGSPREDFCSHGAPVDKARS